MDKVEVAMITGMILIIALIVVCICIPDHNVFIYEDYNGNIGKADKCLSSDKTKSSGGLGTLTCKIYNENKTIQVKWYQVIKENEVENKLKELKEEGKNE